MFTSLASRWRIIRNLLKGSITQYFFLYVLAIISSILEMLGIGIVFPIISSVLKTEGDYGSLPTFLVQPLQDVQRNLNLEILCLFLIVVFIGKNVSVFLVQFESVRFANKIRGKWMHDLFKKYLYSNYAFFTKTKHGVLVNNLFNLTDGCVSGLKQLVSIFMYSGTCLFALIALFIISWEITLGSMSLFFLIYYFLGRSLAAKALFLGESRRKVYENVNAIPADSFKGIREIKTYSAEVNVNDYYNKAVNYMVKLRIRMDFLNFLPTTFPEILLVSFLSVTLIVLNRMTEINLSQLFPLIAMYAYASFRFYSNGSSLLKSYISFSNERTSIKYLYEQIYGEKNKDVKCGNRLMDTALEELRFEKIDFSYTQGKKILNQIKVEFKKGTFTAIVGGSGGGKSTLADLIIRLYEPDSGFIYGDVININEYSLQAWRSQIGFVSQDTFLFHGTIKENISLGFQGDATEKDIFDAAKKANAHEFIMNTEEGYNTVVGEKGAVLSGGQRQRIAIARALIRNPQILILDEATSALDAKSESLVVKSIEAIKKDLILIVIAHRLSTVLNADRILVMKEGTIVEDGKHQELLDKEGEYLQLYRKYS